MKLKTWFYNKFIEPRVERRLEEERKQKVEFHQQPDFVDIMEAYNVAQSEALMKCTVTGRTKGQVQTDILALEAILFEDEVKKKYL